MSVCLIRAWGGRVGGVFSSLCMALRTVLGKRGPLGPLASRWGLIYCPSRVISQGPHLLPSFLLLPIPTRGGNFPILPGSATRMRLLAITVAPAVFS